MEFYIKTFGDPNHDPLKLHSASEVSQLITQLETLFFTKKGEVLGNPDFGLDLEKYIFTLQYNTVMLRGEIEKEIYKYVPLARKFNVIVNVEMSELHSSSIMFVDVSIDNTYKLQVVI